MLLRELLQTGNVLTRSAWIGSNREKPAMTIHVGKMIEKMEMRLFEHETGYYEPVPRDLLANDWYIVGNTKSAVEAPSTTPV